MAVAVLPAVQGPSPGDYGREPEHECAGAMIGLALTEAGVSLID